MGNHDNVDDPYVLLTGDEMAILKEHYTLVRHCASKAETDKALSGWSDKQKRVVVMLQQKVWSYGFVIAGLYPSGSLKFARRIGNPLDQVVALSDDDYLLYRQGKIRFVDGQLARVEG